MTDTILIKITGTRSAANAAMVAGFKSLGLTGLIRKDPDDDDVVYAEVCFNAALAFENGDTLTCELKMQFKLGA